MIRFRKPSPLTTLLKVDLRVALIENAEFVKGSGQTAAPDADLGGENCNVFRHSFCLLRIRKH